MDESLRTVEEIKRSSNHLRGDLAQDLESPALNISPESEQLIKFHGIYAQDHRDVRRKRAQAGLPLEYIFMTRIVIPGGFLSASQWLALDDIASTIADGTLRLTTRQAIQFHGTYKRDLRSLATAIDNVFLSSFAGCGDVVRNVVACPGLQLHGDDRLNQLARRVADRFRPATRAYWEIFVDGQKAISREETVEHSFYGDSYLPRKFKIAVANPEENCVDVFAQDVGIIPTTDAAGSDGYLLTVGGGMGRSYAHETTFARVADPFTFVLPHELDEVIAAIIDAFRDLGDRSNRRRARLKYIVADMGLPAFTREVETRLGRILREPLAVPAFNGRDDHLGWCRSSNGTWHVGIPVASGRVRDTDTAQLRSALRALLMLRPFQIVLSAQQDLLIAGIADHERGWVSDVLKDHGIRLADDLLPIERAALSCPALPTCGQALTESERVMPRVLSDVSGAMRKFDVERRPLALRMTGCPNGCARAGVAEIGVVGRTKSTYDIYVGGSPTGDRLATVYREKVKLEDISVSLEPLLDLWASTAEPDESFGDFIDRTKPWP